MGNAGGLPRMGAMGSDNPSRLLGTQDRGDAMDTSETVRGTRERALVQAVMDSDMPTQPVDKECRVGDLHLAFVGGKIVVKGHDQWWHSDMKEKIDTLSRKSFIMGGGGPVLSVRVAEACNRVLWRELTEGRSAYMRTLRGRRRNGN